MSRILLIESDQILGENIQKMLDKAGHDVDWQVNPQEAMDSANLATPELIILDLLLADHSGVEFLYELRSYPEWQRIPVIVFSGVSAEEFNAANIGFKELDIMAYHYKLTSSVDKLI